MPGFRDEKRERTRQRLIESADRLFRERGFTETTMADIAAASDVSTRTAFVYFPTKDDLLFPDADARIRAAVAAVDAHAGEEDPIAALVTALQSAEVSATDLLDERAVLRLSLMRTEPSVRGRGLSLLADAQAAIGEALRRAYPDRFNAAQAGAIAGAFVGAATGAVSAVMAAMPDASEAERREALENAVSDALSPWTSTH
jgi:AcrR family transcriptional regulator